jgi:hypothetical protein
MKSARQVASKILQTIVKAPWMSSGLADNNPFTTSVVCRAYGFLSSEGLVPDLASSPTLSTFERLWEGNLEILNARALGQTLFAQADPTAEFLWLSLSDITRDRIKQTVNSGAFIVADLGRGLALDLRRVIESGWIFGEARFDKASPKSRRTLDAKPTAYNLVTVNRQLLSDQYPDLIAQPRSLNLTEIAYAISKHSEHFAINSYPPSSTVLYWFVDGISRAKIQLPEDHWTELCTWATREFNKKRSLVVSEHYAMMDPIAMGMAACLCARLRSLCDASEPGTSDKHRSLLPSVIELDHAIGELLDEQTPSGIWPKYFPLFHYQDAGSNFCFAFELLEGLLTEFGRQPPPTTSGSDHSMPKSKLMENDDFVMALEKAVTWCETNRLKCSEKSVAYTGWNSGGQLETLEKGHPESWATAVVHMFLSELVEVLAERIQEHVLRKYRVLTAASKPKAPTQTKTAIGGMLDISIELQDGPHSLAKILTERIVEKYKPYNAASLRRNAPKDPLSALLFGPPGTSKTLITEAVATDLDWPLVSLSPSDFVKGSLANVYVQAHEIFEDLMDLSGVVVFFDEMDALVQTRDDGHLDIASQFLTTMMLPKLTELHDQGRVVFFMATNFQDRFDPAIKRAGRFDLLLCMGPPSLDEKLKNLSLFLGKESIQSQLDLARDLLLQYGTASPDSKDRLELFTFGEFKSFLKSLGEKTDIGQKLKDMGEPKFREHLVKYSSHVTLRLQDLEPLGKTASKSLADAYKLQLSLKDLVEGKIKITPIMRYLCDRRESKDQH